MKETEEDVFGVLAKLMSSNEYDDEDQFVYMDWSSEMSARIRRALELVREHQGDTVLKLVKVKVDGPTMIALDRLPELTVAEREELEREYSIRMRVMPWDELKELEGKTRLCCEGVEVMDEQCLFAVAYDKHSLDVYEADVRAVWASCEC